MKQCKMDLFPECIGYCPHGAVFSQDKQYRYRLWRKWGEGSNIMFIGLNPSTANESTNDPTIRRLIGFAKQWEYTGISMYNLFGLVSAYPEALLTNKDPIQEPNTNLNNEWLMNGFMSHETIVFCWGSWKISNLNDRVKTIVDELKTPFQSGKKVMCFGTNKDGQPKHPLYLNKNTELIKFES